MLIGPLAGAAVGLVLGTAVEARQINVVFAVVLTPLLFTGATFYPWAALDSMRWFQVVTLLNPLTYVSEGLRAAVEVRRRWPEGRIMVLSQYVEVSYADELLAAGGGGVGYLLKDRVSDLDDFLTALDTVAAGGTVLDPQVVAQLMVRRRDPLEGLTPREREVLGLMAEGRSNTAIADRLVVGLPAVEKHVTSILTKLGLAQDADDHRRVLAVLRWLEQNPGERA